MHLYTYYAATGKADALDEIGNVPMEAESPEACILDRWVDVEYPERFIVIDHTAAQAHVFKTTEDGRLKRVLSSAGAHDDED